MIHAAAATSWAPFIQRKGEYGRRKRHIKWIEYKRNLLTDSLYFYFYWNSCDILCLSFILTITLCFSLSSFLSLIVSYFYLLKYILPIFFFIRLFYFIWKQQYYCILSLVLSFLLGYFSIPFVAKTLLFLLHTLFTFIFMSFFFFLLQFRKAQPHPFVSFARHHNNVSFTLCTYFYYLLKQYSIWTKQ